MSSNGRSPWHPSALLAGLVVSLAAGGIIWYLQTRADPAAPNRPKDLVHLVGGCQPFSVYAQNRWNPAGATLRAGPTRNGRPIGNFDPNELVLINGWVRGDIAYPTNPTPFDSDVWFHVADDRGWVSYAAVRADPTTFDPTGLDPAGGRPVPLDPQCSGAIR